MWAVRAQPGQGCLPFWGLVEQGVGRRGHLCWGESEVAEMGEGFHIHLLIK